MEKHPLKMAREQAALTQQQVASFVGTDTGNISRLERGEQLPSPETAAKLRELFPGVTLDDIYKAYRPKPRGKPGVIKSPEVKAA